MEQEGDATTQQHGVRSQQGRSNKRQMELKSAERDVQELELLYLRVRRYDDRLPPLECDGNDDAPPSGASNEVSPPVVDVSNDDTDNSSPPPPASATEAMRCLEDCRDRTETLQERIAKLERRLGDNDPVTGTPRYGEQTLARVVTLLRRYRHLQSAMQQCFLTALDGESGATTTSENTAVASMRHAAQSEEDEARRSREEEAARRQREEEEREAAERRRIDEAKRREEEVAREEELRIAEQARQAQEARMAAVQAREEADRLDRMWVQSVERGVEGVRKQLSILVESTESDDDPLARKIAIEALHTLFSQIVARPEEPNFRRIRRDHAKFHADIGRHKGGREVLLAAGFELGSIDDVPCFLSKEPNIEKDMDGWAAWFDLLKGALEAIEEQLIALP
jgi:PUB domain